VVSAGELEALDVVAKRFERDYLLRVLRSVAGNRGRAAEILGLTRKGLWGKLKSHGISDDDIEQDDAH
jgi:DNA-binding NtrC family response regulator